LASAATKSSLLQILRSESLFSIVARAYPNVECVVGEMRQIGVPVLRDLKPGRHPDPLVLSM